MKSEQEILTAKQMSVCVRLLLESSPYASIWLSNLISPKTTSQSLIIRTVPVGIPETMVELGLTMEVLINFLIANPKILEQLLLLPKKTLPQKTPDAA